MDPTPRLRGPMILIRVLGAMLRITLIVYAYGILDNIWHYNDSGTLTYVVFAAVPGVTGMLLLYLSLRRPRPARGSR